jgi:transposase
MGTGPAPMRNHSHTTSTKADGFRRLEVITGVGRRRRWTLEEKARIVAESLDPAVSVSAVARRHGINPNQLFVWRKAFEREHGAAGVAERRGGMRSSRPETAPEPIIEVVVGAMTVRLPADLSSARLRRVLEVLRGLA